MIWKDEAKICVYGKNEFSCACPTMNIFSSGSRRNRQG